jgi:hypothetical protein
MRRFVTFLGAVVLAVAVAGCASGQKHGSASSAPLPVTVPRTTIPSPSVAIRSTRSREANAPEVRQWRKKPLAVQSGGDESVVRFVLPGNGCKPKAMTARVEGKRLTLLLRVPTGCTLPARFYEVTVSLAKPVLRPITTVVARYAKIGRGQEMPLRRVVYG